MYLVCGTMETRGQFEHFSGEQKIHSFLSVEPVALKLDKELMAMLLRWTSGRCKEERRAPAVSALCNSFRLNDFWAQRRKQDDRKKSLTARR
jgi:hypothetical protein